MRSYCKGVNITDLTFVRRAVGDWLRGKRNRADARQLLEEYGGEDALAEALASEIRERRVSVAPIQYFNRTEPISGKHRVIGRESAKHQCLDYVAVNGLMELFQAKIGWYQTASIPGKGQTFAQRAIKKWVRKPGARYYVKLDVRKCYPSVDQAVLRSMLRRDVRNPDLIYLTYTLLDQFPRGLNIGSYLSQYLANYYLSSAYHYAQEGLFKVRHGKSGDRRVRLIDNCLFYMDDILLMGHDKRDLRMAARMMCAYFSDALHLELKPWKVCRVDCEPIDMVGYVFRRDRTTIMAGIFLRARRALVKASRRERIPLQLAYRCISYNGYLSHSDSKALSARYGVADTIERCKAVVSLAAREGRAHEGIRAI